MQWGLPVRFRADLTGKKKELESPYGGRPSFGVYGPLIFIGTVVNLRASLELPTGKAGLASADRKRESLSPTRAQFLLVLRRGVALPSISLSRAAIAGQSNTFMENRFGIRSV